MLFSCGAISVVNVLHIGRQRHHILPVSDMDDMRFVWGIESGYSPRKSACGRIHKPWRSKGAVGDVEIGMRRKKHRVISYFT
jgi:hypothetical protein